MGVLYAMIYFLIPRSLTGVLLTWLFWGFEAITLFSTKDSDSDFLNFAVLIFSSEESVHCFLLAAVFVTGLARLATVHLLWLELFSAADLIFLQWLVVVNFDVLQFLVLESV